MTRKQIKQLIENTRHKILLIDRDLEKYEFKIHNLCPKNKNELLIELDDMRSKHRKTRDKTNDDLFEIERALEYDDRVNGWKGDDRIVEL